jgi:hypothetical protein
MRLYTLDDIVRAYLVKKNKSMHYYLDFLVHAVDAIREISLDTMKVVRTVKIPVNSYKAVVLPGDYVDWIKIGFARGQYNVQMSNRQSFNRLNNLDDNGVKIPYEDIVGDENVGIGEWDGLAYAWSTNDNGEILGRVFNNGAGTTQNSFKVLRERGEIQLDNRFEADYIILEYIGDGLDGDADTEVHPYSLATIEAYISWKSSRNADNIQSPEGYNFYNNHRILRARMNEISLLDIQRSKEKGYKATIKN